MSIAFQADEAADAAYSILALAYSFFPVHTYLRHPRLDKFILNTIAHIVHSSASVFPISRHDTDNNPSILLLMHYPPCKRRQACLPPCTSMHMVYHHQYFAKLLSAIYARNRHALKPDTSGPTRYLKREPAEARVSIRAGNELSKYPHYKRNKF